MREQLEARLTELEQEYAFGERRLRDVDLEQARLREALLRMSGAVQVLRELLDPPDPASDSQPQQTRSGSGNGREQSAAVADTAKVASP